MKSRFSHLGDLIKSGLRKSGLQGAVKEHAAIDIWPEVVGEKTASVTRPERIREGILYVTCRDSMWAQQLHFLRPVIIEKINEQLEGNVVREIRLSGVGFKDSGKHKVDAAQPVVKESVKLTKEEAAVIEQAAGSIQNPELADKVARALKASKSMQKRMK